MRNCIAGPAALLAIALSAGAQNRPAPDVTLQFPPGIRALNQGWRTHSGDNPGWAQPSFNDSAWPAISLTPPSDYAGWRWYRLHVALPADHPPLALLLSGGNGTYEVYINGTRMPGPALKPPLRVTLTREQVVPLPAVGDEAEIALRTDVPRTSMFVADRGAWRVRIGTLPAVDEAQRAILEQRLNATLPGIGISLLVILAGIPVLLLFWRQPDHREYLWLGLYLIGAATGSIAFKLAQSGFIPFSFDWFWADATTYPIMVAQIEFTFSFVGTRVTRGWRLCEALLLAPLICLEIPAWQGFISRGVMNLEEATLTIPASVALFVLLLIWYRRGYRESSWLILPSLPPMLSVAIIELAIASSYLGWDRIARIGDPLRIGVFSLQPYDIADLLFLLAIGIVMFLRFTRVSREQARTAAELEAAQRIQALLLRSASSAQSRFRIDTVYRPAQEVGGDFFHTAQIDGFIRIVVGDVSGKGLAAAMLVSAIIGALDTLHDTAPVSVLRKLNELLIARQQDGFATCICAAVAPDGTITLASAGHLAPYHDGEELPLPSALPLGLSAETEYAGTTLSLAPGDTLTFLSDGVVEARSPTGELFGFDRTRQISTQSTKQIADKAQSFGQQDDITVLTLTFAPAEVLRA
jgi:phosphoserine phosphatase RsbU/P